MNTDKMEVPLIDLEKQLSGIRSEIESALSAVLNSCAFASGLFVERFEDEFAEFCGSKYAVGVGSGTEALWLALLALGIGPGDEVITVPNTFIATAEAISFAGAKPVFVDIQEDSFNIDPLLIEAAITSRTKAIIPVHLFGQMADMDPIMAIASSRGLAVIEDASQAHGAEYKDKRAGSIGDMGCFSFYPSKNLGACGEAGMIITDKKPLRDRLRMLRDHGQHRKYHHRLIGWNGRMDGFQGAVLSVKLKYLQEWNQARTKHANLYDALLCKVPGITIPARMQNTKHVFHIYAIRVHNRDQMLKALSDDGIKCGVHYPVPIHLQEAYKWLGYSSGTFPVAERSCLELISLPMYPELSEAQICYTAERISLFIENSLH